MMCFCLVSEMNVAVQLVLFSVTFGLIVTGTLAQTGLCAAPSGDFPNPSSELCTTFFRCVQGQPSLLRCPTNQRFDFLFRFCRPQESVDCSSQLQLFAAPPLLSEIGLLPLSATGASVGLGLGAQLSDSRIIGLLNQLDGGDTDRQTADSPLATLLMMSALMNQRNSANRQESSASFPLGNLYLDNSQSFLGSLGDQESLVTKQDYQQLDAILGRQNANATPDNGLPLGAGKTIFLPQLQPSIDRVQPWLHQGQTVPAEPENGAGDLGHRGATQGATQGQASFAGPGNPADNTRGSGRLAGHFTDGNSTLTRRISRRRGPGQRRNIHGHLTNQLPENTDIPAVNVDSTADSVV